MRLDRFVTLDVVHPLRRASSWLPRWGAPSAARGRALPILMYHSVSADRETGVTPYYRTATSPQRFFEHMRLLRARGWRAVGLRDGLRAAAELPAEKLVVLTFDDGFRDFYSEALPVLQKFDFGATLFLPTAFISEDQTCRQFRGRDCLSWQEVREVQRNGVELGSHTVHHPRLTILPWPEIESEIALSKSDMERHLGCAVTSFSYPFAFPQLEVGFCARFRGLLSRAGYQACVTTEIGCAAAGDDPYRLRRLPVNDADDPALFAAKLDGDYDWLAVPQRTYKALRFGH